MDDQKVAEIIDIKLGNDKKFEVQYLYQKDNSFIKTYKVNISDWKLKSLLINYRNKLETLKSKDNKNNLLNTFVNNKLDILEEFFININEYKEKEESIYSIDDLDSISEKSEKTKKKVPLNKKKRKITNFINRKIKKAENNEIKIIDFFEIAFKYNKNNKVFKYFND